MALRGADAVHLASALVLESRLVDAEDRLIFVAADRELKEAAQASASRLSSIQKNKSDRLMSDAGAGAQEDNEA